MKKLALILTLVTLTSCSPSVSGGTYQSEDQAFGIRFVDEDDAVLYGDWGDETAVSYEIIGGENLKIETPLAPIIMDLEVNRGSITLGYQGEEIVLQKVPEITILSAAQRQTQRAQESEAKTYIGALNRAQQAHYLEFRQFTESMDELGLGIIASTDNYNYSIDASTSDVVISTAIPNIENLRGAVGAVFPVSGQESGTTRAIICQSTEPGATPQPPFLDGGEPTCADGTTN